MSVAGNEQGATSATMGSKEERRHVTVLVTGFEAFQARYPINPSFEIARALPSIIENSTSQCSIQVILHKPPVKVVYETTRELIPRLLKAYDGIIDLVLHIGMASSRSTYTIEKYARRDGYTGHKDLDGQVPGEDHTTKHFCDCPEKMTSSLDYDRLWQDWFAHVEDINDTDAALTRAELCKSEDAGRYLCDYIYLNSLAYYDRQRRDEPSAPKVTDRPVMFLHVPGASDEHTIRRGTVATIALIRAMAEQIY